MKLDILKFVLIKIITVPIFYAVVAQASYNPSANPTMLVNLSDVNSATVNEGRLLISDGTEFESMALQGDCTMNGAGFISCSPSVTWSTGTGSIIYYSAGNVGINTSSPSQNLEINGNLEFSTTTSSAGIIYSGSSRYIHATGTQNMFMGVNAGNLTLSGTELVGVGLDALVSLTSGSYNTAVGRYSGSDMTGADYNTSLGGDSLEFQNGTDGNTAVGYAAMEECTAHVYNTAIGYAAHYSDFDGSCPTYNTAIGSYADFYIESTSWNSFIGYAAAVYNQDGDKNVILGYYAGLGAAPSNRYRSVYIGARSGVAINTNGNDNIFIGYQAGDTTTTGDRNILIGYDIEAPSATTSNFMSLGNLIFGTTLDGTGTTISTGNVGIGHTAPAQALEVEGDIRLDFNGTATTNGVCHSGAASDTTAADRDLVVCSAAPADIAEWYDAPGTEPGDIVVTTSKEIEFSSPLFDAMTGEQKQGRHPTRVSSLKPSTHAYDSQILGVVSTSPVETLGRNILQIANHPQAVALIGRVPVKVNLENGPIRAGDLITASSNKGSGMRAIQPGRVIGLALESVRDEKDLIDKKHKIMVFVNPHWAGEVADIAKINHIHNAHRKIDQRLAALEEFLGIADE